MRTRRFAFAAVAATAALVLAACGGDDEPTTEPEDVSATDFPEGSTMAELADAGSITVGTKFDQPLFGLVGPDGVPVGFDVEIAKIIAGKLGIDEENIEWVETVSANREQFIQDGQVDIVVATYTINDERKQIVDFAGPYYEAGQNILVKKDDTTITGPDSFKDGTKKVCSVTGSTPAENIKQYVKDVGTQLVLFDTYDKCRDALKGGQVDAVTTDNVILLGYIAKDEASFKLAGDNFTKEPYGIGVKKEDTAFRTFINDTLEKAIADGRWKKAWDDTAGKFGAELGTPPTINRY